MIKIINMILISNKIKVLRWKYLEYLDSYSEIIE